MNLIEFGWFTSHSNFQLPWKIDCDALSDGDIESLVKLICWKFAFGEVYGVPRGGVRLAEALKPYCREGYPLLIVDDVLTTGRSMIAAFDQQHGGAGNKLTKRPIGVVIFARGPCPDWVWPIFTVNELFQSRAIGLG